MQIGHEIAWFDTPLRMYCWQDLLTAMWDKQNMFFFFNDLRLCQVPSSLRGFQYFSAFSSSNDGHVPHFWSNPCRKWSLWDLDSGSAKLCARRSPLRRLNCFGMGWPKMNLGTKFAFFACLCYSVQDVEVKWGYPWIPWIIHFTGIFHYKSSILGYPHDYGNLYMIPQQQI